MKKLNLMFAIALIGLMSITTLSSCKKEGCIDAKADNYDEEAKKDDGSCTYPTVSLSSSGDGDVTGKGGSASDSFTWNNPEATADYNMDITASSGGSFQLIVKDADGTTVLDETLSDSSSDDSKSGVTASGTAGDWTVTVNLTDFNGDGSFSLSAGN